MLLALYLSLFSLLWLYSALSALTTVSTVSSYIVLLYLVYIVLEGNLLAVQIHTHLVTSSTMP